MYQLTVIKYCEKVTTRIIVYHLSTSLRNLISRLKGYTRTMINMYSALLVRTEFSKKRLSIYSRTCVLTLLFLNCVCHIYFCHVFNVGINYVIFDASCVLTYVS